MKYAKKKLRLVLCGMAGACLSFSAGCEDRSAKLAEAKYYQQQEETLKRQNAEWERQLERAEAQDKRYDVIIAKQEEQAERVDVLLIRWGRLLTVLEEHYRDR